MAVGVKRKYESLRRNFKDSSGEVGDKYVKQARYDRRKKRVCRYDNLFKPNLIVLAEFFEKAECNHRKRKKFLQYAE